MFEGEKTNLFWVGLLVLGFSVLVLFAAIWQTLHSVYLAGQYGYNFSNSFVWSIIPIIVGGIIFILIGWYMMKSGVKKDTRPP
jgi:hypothetical protein